MSKKEQNEKEQILKDFKDALEQYEGKPLKTYKIDNDTLNDGIAVTVLALTSEKIMRVETTLFSVVVDMLKFGLEDRAYRYLKVLLELNPHMGHFTPTTFNQYHLLKHYAHYF